MRYTSASAYPKKDKPKHYLKNKDLVIEIIESKKLNKLTYKAEQMLILLAKKAITKMYYKNDDDKHDCLQTALLDMFKNWRHFDTNRSTNAFAYFTEIAKRGFARGWGDLYSHKGDPNKETTTFSYTSFGHDDENTTGWMI